MTALTDAAKAVMLNQLATSAVFASLHTAFPGSAGTSELTGGTPPYARKPIAWNTAAAGNIHNAINPAFDVPGGSTVKWVGFFSLVTAGTYYGASPLGSGVPKPFTAQASTDTVTCEAHGLSAGTRVVFFATQGTGVPGGLVEGTDYYVISPTTNTFQVSATSGGSAIDLTADGAGFVTTIVPETFGNQGSLTVTSADINVNS